jgi:diguanylate cyclase (GGDEF)-like protein
MDECLPVLHYELQAMAQAQPDTEAPSTRPGRAAELVRAMFERRPDPYEGADLDASRGIMAALLGLTAVLSLAFLPLEPVDDQIGWAGWIVAAALICAGFAGAVAVARRRPSYDQLLVIAYLGVAAIAALNWLAGGGSSAYEDLFVLWLGAGAMHPPRRAFTHLAVMLAALALPLLYEGTGSEIVMDMIAEALILVVLSSILVTYLFHVRRQRLGLQSGVEVARRLARVDAPTGLGNRRAFDEALTVEVAHAAREGVPLSVGLVDIEGLRRVNEGWGHLEGDRCLREVALTMERSVRTTDRCFRWGGDEFVLVLPGSSRTVADDVLGRMAENVEQSCTAPDGRGIELTWGAAEITVGTSAEDALARADVALLERKTEKRR